MRSDWQALRDAIAPGDRPRALRLALLMVAAAASEGLGLALLVPILSALDIGSAGQWGAWLTRLRLPVSLGVLLCLFVALVALRAVLNQVRAVAEERFRLGTVRALRQRAWRALLHGEWRVLSSLQRADAASTLIGEVERVGYGLRQGIAAVGILFTLSAVLIAALAISPLITAAAAASGGVILLAYAGLRRRARHLGERIGRAYAAMHASFAEGLASLRTIKSLGGEAQAEASAMVAVRAMEDAHIAYVRDRGLGQVALHIGGAVSLAALVWLAVNRWHLGALAVLPMVAVFARAVPLLGQLQEAWLQWRHVRPALESTLALITAAEAAREPDPEGQSVPPLRRDLQLRQVTVRFDGAVRPALDGIDLVVPARGIVALTGPSGAGKSTLADLLGGLLSPDAGTILLDGQPLAPGARGAWRKRVAYVHQDPVLMAASLRENLIWGKAGVSDAMLETALREAAADFAFDWPQGLDTVLGDGGRVLSGGERQRLMLARALLREPDLLVLDEATSALDAASETQIARAVAGLGKRMAVVVISHRGALLALADQTVSLDCGRIVAKGDRAGANGDDG